MSMSPFLGNILRVYNQPFAAWLLVPLVPLLTGSILGARSESFQFYPFLLLYLFEVFLCTMELVLRKQLKKPVDIPPLLRNLFLAVGGLILILMTVATNWIVSSLLLLAAVFCVVAYRDPFRMVGSPYYLLLQLFFQGIIVGFLSFYVQTRYLDISLLLYLLPALFLTAAYIIIQEADVLSTTPVKSIVGKNAIPYQQFLVEKEPLLTVLLTITAVLVAFMLLLSSVTEGWKQILFLILVLLIISPLLSAAFRKSLKPAVFYPLFSTLVLTLFTVLINSPYP